MEIRCLDETFPTPRLLSCGRTPLVFEEIGSEIHNQGVCYRITRVIRYAHDCCYHLANRAKIWRGDCATQGRSIVPGQQAKRPHNVNAHGGSHSLQTLLMWLNAAVDKPERCVPRACGEEDAMETWKPGTLM